MSDHPVPTPRPAAMTPEEFRKIINDSGVDTITAVAKLLCVTRPTVYRWLNGEVPISERTADSINFKLIGP